MQRGTRSDTVLKMGITLLLYQTGKKYKDSAKYNTKISMEAYIQEQVLIGKRLNTTIYLFHGRTLEPNLC
jgi:hypothetical protein